LQSLEKKPLLLPEAGEEAGNKEVLRITVTLLAIFTGEEEGISIFYFNFIPKFY